MPGPHLASSHAAYGVVVADREAGAVLSISLPVWISECIMPVTLSLLSLRLAWMASNDWRGRAIAFLGIAGALVAMALAVLTLVFQLLDPVFVSGVLGVGAWFAAGIVWFALVGRHRLVLSPEEEFAQKQRH